MLVGALASAIAVVQRCVVLDLAYPAVAPWPRSVTSRAACGLTTDPPTAATAASMTSRRALLAPAGAGFDVLTDVTDLTAEPAETSPDLTWWLTARNAGDWPLAIVDAGEPLLADPIAARWCRRPGVITALAVPTTRPAVAGTARLVTAWEHHPLVRERLVLVPVDTAPGRRDATVLAELAMLDHRVARTVAVRFDAQLHHRGIAGVDRMSRRAVNDYIGVAERCLQLLQPTTVTDTPAATDVSTAPAQEVC